MKRHGVVAEDRIAAAVVDAALKVHRALGPGVLESVYEAALAYELGKRGVRVARQKPIPIYYDSVRFDEGFRADLVVEGKVIVELKAVEHTVPVHEQQLLSYLRLADVRLGLLINFGEALIKDRITRVVNGLPDVPRTRL